MAATNITGNLLIGQLPDTIAKKTDIPEVPTKVSELENDTGYLTKTGVVSIVDGTVTADYVSGLDCEFTTGKIGAWCFEDGILRSSSGYYGILNYSAMSTNGLETLVSNSSPQKGYVFTALTTRGIVYYIKTSKHSL